MHDDHELTVADAAEPPISVDAPTPGARPTRPERRILMPWSSRVKLAVALSTLILIGVMVVQKFRGSGAPPASALPAKPKDRTPAAPALAISGKPVGNPEPAKSQRPEPPSTLVHNAPQTGRRGQEPPPPPVGEAVVTPVSHETASAAGAPPPPVEAAGDSGSSGTPAEIAAVSASGADDPPPPPAETASGLVMTLPDAMSNSQPTSPPPAGALREPEDPFRGLTQPTTPPMNPADDHDTPRDPQPATESNREPISDRSQTTTGTPPVEPFEPTPVEPQTTQVPAVEAPPPRPIRDPSPAPSAAPEEVVGSRIAPVTHVVRRGENFWTIARHYYGSGRFYRALWKANAERVPQIDELYVGTSILVPAPEDLDKSLIDPTGAPRGHARDSVAPADEATARRDAETRRTSRPEADRDEEPVRSQPRRRVHIVRPYETLRSIAKKQLGDARREDELLKLNDDLIDDPYNLPVGTPLRLPVDPLR